MVLADSELDCVGVKRPPVEVISASDDRDSISDDNDSEEIVVLASVDGGRGIFSGSSGIVGTIEGAVILMVSQSSAVT